MVAVSLSVSPTLILAVLGLMVTVALSGVGSDPSPGFLQPGKVRRSRVTERRALSLIFFMVYIILV